MRILHLITSLRRGGAEHMLYKLLSVADKTAFDLRVVSMIPGGIYAQRIAELGVPVSDLSMQRGMFSVSALFRLRSILRAYRPDVVHCWMYHANMIGVLGHLLAGSRSALVWSVRHTVGRMSDERWSTRLAIMFNAGVSWIPKQILYNSRVSAERHVALGFSRKAISVIPNGFDHECLRYDDRIRAEVRAENGVGPGDVVVLHAARFHPMKDHGNLLNAAALLSGASRRFVFLLAGSSVTRENSFFRRIHGSPNVRIELLGERDDIPRLLNAADIACLSSAYGEAFPNFLGEAMAIGVPCVATDVGDSAYVIGDTGIVVPPRQPDALAKGILALATEAAESIAKRRAAARQRIESEFSLRGIAGQYEDLYASLMLSRFQSDRTSHDL